MLKIDSDWHVASTWREDYANVLAKLYRKSKCQPEEVLALFQITCNQLQNRESKIDTKDALECAMHYQISVYDAHFIVLAEQLRTYLITEDIEVLKKCSKQTLSMNDFISQNPYATHQ